MNRLTIQSTLQRGVLRWAVLGLLLFSFAAASYAQVAVGISVRFGPPAIPVYAQPICPGPGYFWTPGFWAWNDDGGYYWVPGTWVVAPVGMLWTPGYWGWGGGFYAWHAGYWGPHVGFYGGINYGFGYTGVGFGGGEWRGREFFYNRSVTNVSVTNVTRVYNRTVIVNNSHVSYNGGAGGINVRATREEENWAHERHMDALDVQREHQNAAVRNRENFASENHGRPMYAATARPGDFSRRSAVEAREAGGEYHAPAMSPREARVGGDNRGGRPNEGFRPFTPPNKGGSPENEHRNNDSRVESRGNDNRPNENRGSEVHNNVSRPQNQMHEQPKQSERAPQRESKPAPAPKHENPPKDDHHRGR
ncbi:MAG TPA: hypothetical protein VGG04_11980 [Candidatus Sulfotelmatobacter sp.]